MKNRRNNNNKQDEHLSVFTIHSKPMRRWPIVTDQWSSKVLLTSLSVFLNIKTPSWWPISAIGISFPKKLLKIMHMQRRRFGAKTDVWLWELLDMIEKKLVFYCWLSHFDGSGWKCIFELWLRSNWSEPNRHEVDTIRIQSSVRWI